MDGYAAAESISCSPYDLILKALSLIPPAHYAAFVLSFLLVFLYNLLEIHFLRDILTGFRGNPVSLTYNASSELYRSVVSNCKVLRGRYLPTVWLCSPHLQTAFVSFFGNPPRFAYKRVLFYTSDGGTIALDWLLHSHVNDDAADNLNETVPKKTDKAPILIVIPGLTSDSDAPYVKHLVLKMAKQGWNVVVPNHRGLGGVQITSDWFYTAGGTEDSRTIIEHVHQEYPDTPLYVVGTSIGANILVKYLGEDSVNVPILGAVAVCSPWDLTSHSIRDFDHYFTRIIGKFETVDTYYRRSSSVNYVGNVAVPLLCINALDDPVCTRESIPWDECRMNPNIVLAATEHGGHLAYYEGITASNMWWVRATCEFLEELRSSSLKDIPKRVEPSSTTSPLKSKIDQRPFVKVVDDGTVAVVAEIYKDDTAVAATDGHMPKKMDLGNSPESPSEQKFSHMIDPIKKEITQVRGRSRTSIWLLAYIAIVTTWPVLGSGLLFFLKKKSRRTSGPPTH
ncbi:Embryogenesis-associated protein EMB8 [Linum grandiflorum]